MNRHVFGTFLLGATVTWLLAYAVHLAGFTTLSYLVAAFFGAVTGVATVTDYIEQRQRQDYDAEHVLPKVTVLNASDEEIPEEVRKIIESFAAENGAPAAVIKVTKRTIPVPAETSQLTPEELSEIEEKFS